MPNLTLPAISKEYLYFTGIKAFDADSPDHVTDPTTLPVEVAIVAVDTDPSEPDWHLAQWVGQATARILTGTGGVIAPEAGRYAVWLRITGAVEQPSRKIGQLDVD